MIQSLIGGKKDATRSGGALETLLIPSAQLKESLETGLRLFQGHPQHAEHVAATVKVVIDKLVFVPAEISVTVGDTIEWVNKDVMVHTATVDGGFDVLIPAKKSASAVVTGAGTLDYYYCRYHPNMRGRIAVQAK